MARLYDPNNILLMDGTASIIDLISGASFTMAGTPTTTTILGATAPVISDTEYTSCSIATPWAAGTAISVLFAVKSTWKGSDTSGGQYCLLWNQGTGQNLVYLDIAYAVIRLVTRDASNVVTNRNMTINDTNWPAGTHIVIATLAADNTRGLYLDGVAATTLTGTGARESVVNATTFFGIQATSNRVNAGILVAIWNRVLTAAEITSLSSVTAWTTLTNQLATGQPRIERRRRLHNITGG